MVFEKENPVTFLMRDPEKGCIREDVLEEKVLSCIIESKTGLDKVPDILGVLKALAPSLDTVISLGVSTRCDENGDDPLREILQGMGYDPGSAWSTVLCPPGYVPAGRVLTVFYRINLKCLKSRYRIYELEHYENFSFVSWVKR